MGFYRRVWDDGSRILELSSRMKRFVNTRSSNFIHEKYLLIPVEYTGSALFDSRLMPLLAAEGSQLLNQHNSLYSISILLFPYLIFLNRLYFIPMMQNSKLSKHSNHSLFLSKNYIYIFSILHIVLWTLEEKMYTESKRR